ncbi:non-ribosomal peptide synthetase [Bacillus cereus]|uniref:non-ribosomal peptide synthetase n=1 Tax=Bacillus cereus TaxID=1396 RepID=UPI004039CD22
MNVIDHSISQERDYWLNKLKGDLMRSSFPYDFGHFSNETYELKFKEFELDNELTSRLLKISNNSSYRVHMILVATITALLYKYTGNKDVLLGSTIYNQQSEGDFLNSLLALRNKIEPDFTFKDILLNVKQTINEATENQNYPIETLLYKLNLSLEDSDFPLFDVAVILENVQKRKYLDGIKVNALFSFEIKEDMQLKGKLEYNPHKYSEETIKRISNNFVILMREMIFNVDMPLKDIDILSEKEKKQVLFDFNSTKSDYILTKNIVKLFEKQAKTTPFEIAACFEGVNITYKELNEKANHLANILKSKGVSKGKYIPVMMERSMEVLISLIGIMKLGSVYVPLDINWPINRLKNILEELKSSVVLVNSNLDLNEFDVLHQEDLVKVDIKKLDNRVDNLDISVDLKDPMYVIYTSGSTGKPKGAINKHEGIANRFLYMNEKYGCSSNDTILLTSNHNFDASIWQLLWPLINGAKVVIPSHTKGFDIDGIVKLIENEKVTITDFVPSVFKLLINKITSNQINHSQLKSLRQLLIGGEQMNSHDVYNFKKYFPHIGITNTYGPAETSIGTIFYDITNDYCKIIPIGKPISNVNTLILDENLKPVPIGVSGEIYLGGICVGLGYVNDQEKTNKSFIDLQLPGYQNQRFYKTGDLGRWLSDGNIEFLGRIDNQIKIRGIRIELEEIKSLLLDMNGIEQVEILVYEPELENEKSICAYIVTKNKYTINELREYLLNYIPQYMIPKNFVFVDKILLTPNGKVDFNSLPSPTYTKIKNGISPRNEVEQTLANIWSDLLGVSSDDIDIESNFFELGGHSLLITLQVAEIKSKLGIDISLLTAFEKPTIRQLAQEIGEKLLECKSNE